MNFKHSLVIYRKELMEVLRDKRTIFTTFILPIILYPLIIVGFNSIMIRQTKSLEERGATVAVQDSVNNSISRQLIQDLTKIKNYTIIPYSETTSRLYEDKDIQCIVIKGDDEIFRVSYMCLQKCCFVFCMSYHLGDSVFFPVNCNAFDAKAGEFVVGRKSDIAESSNQSPLPLPYMRHKFLPDHLLHLVEVTYKKEHCGGIEPFFAGGV